MTTTTPAFYDQGPRQSGTHEDAQLLRILVESAPDKDGRQRFTCVWYTPQAFFRRRAQGYFAQLAPHVARAEAAGKRVEIEETIDGYPGTISVRRRQDQ